MKKSSLGDFLFSFVVYIIVILILSPILIILLLSFSKSGFEWPPSGFTLQWYLSAFAYKPFISGLKISFALGLTSSIFATSLGITSSMALVRYNFKGKNICNVIFMSPLMIPIALTGLALYMYMARMGIMGSFFSLLIGHTILLMPYSLRLISASFQTVSKPLEEAAINLGASSTKVFFSIILPMIRTGIISGFLMCFLVSWNSFALSMFLAGPDAYPLPLQLFDYIKYEWSPVVLALSGILIYISIVAIVIIDRVVGLTVAVGATKS